MATNASTITTAEQLWAADIDQPCELIRGELVLMSPTGDYHCASAGVFAGSLWSFARKRKLGKVFVGEPGYIIQRDPDTVRVPDVAFTFTEKLVKYGRTEKFMPYAPDIVVEVVSPSERANDVEQKKELWLAAGCQMVFVVARKTRTVRQYFANGHCNTLTEADTISGGEVLPGWQLDVQEVFE
jgi:Uma2 family endonuclease